MNLKENIIKEFQNWKPHEIVIFSVSTLLILLISIFNNEHPIAILHATCGILYTLLSGKGRISCYAFGIIATFCYSYLAYKNHIYGNLVLNMCFYLPLEIYGIFAWKKHLKNGSNEIVKTSLKATTKVFWGWFSVKNTIVLIILLKTLSDFAPYLDAATTVISITAMYFTVKRYIEQWLLWTVVNMLTILMWLKLSTINSNTYTTLVVYGTYLVLGIYFYYKWKKELSDIDSRESNLQSAG